MNRKSLTAAAILCLLVSCSNLTPFVQKYNAIYDNGLKGAIKMVKKDDSWKHERVYSEWLGEEIGILENLILSRQISLYIARYLIQQGAVMCKFKEPYTSSICLSMITTCTFVDPVRLYLEYSPEEIIDTIDCAIEHGAVVGTFPTKWNPLGLCDDVRVAEYWLAKGLSPLDGWDQDTAETEQGKPLIYWETFFSPLAIVATSGKFDVFKLYVDHIGFDKLTERDKGYLMFFTLANNGLTTADEVNAKFEYLIQLGLNPAKYKDKYGRSLVDLFASSDKLSWRSLPKEVREKYIKEHETTRERDMILLPIWIETEEERTSRYARQSEERKKSQ